MTEQDLQERLWYEFHHRLAFIPNCVVFGNESDVLTVTKAGYIDEYEIKLTRSDFLADRKKHRFKHYDQRPERSVFELRGGGYVDLGQYHYPNRFWYVCPADLVKPGELPSYAGLIELTDEGRLDKRVKAPLMHKDKISDKLVLALFQKTARRAWLYRARLKQNGINLVETEDEIMERIKLA